MLKKLAALTRKKLARKGPTAITGLYCSELGHECTSEHMLASNRDRLFGDLDEDSTQLYEKLLGKPTRRRKYVVPYDEIISDYSLETKFDRFRETALALMADACEGLLRTTGLQATDFDYLITNYMAGKTLPSLSALIANHLGLRKDVVSLTLGDMGCSAGVASLDLAVRLLRGESRPQRALVISLEPVSNLFEHSERAGAIVGNTLFGEGCAAVAVSTHREPALWHVRHTVRTLKADDDGVDAIQLEAGATGPRIHLSKSVPQVAGDAIKDNLTRMVPNLLSAVDKARYLVTKKVPRWQKRVDRWALHPGGIQVLRALQKNLKLVDADVGPSYRVFEERSNMSSPSCFYALQNIEKAAPEQGEQVLMMSFGSGFKVNSVLLEKADKRHHAKVELNAVVVGGTSGIGLDTARQLAATGYNTIVGSRRVGEPDADYERIPGVTYLPLDVTDDESVKGFADQVWEQTFGVDVMVLSSGVAAEPSLVGAGSAEEWARTVDTNLTGSMRVANALIGRVRTHGHVVFLNSILGQIPLMGNAAYCASKAGLRHFAESLEVELKRAGRKVAVHSIYPAYVNTPMLDEVQKRGKTFLKPVDISRVTEQIDEMVRGKRNGQNFVLTRDHAIAGLYHWAPDTFKEIVSSL